MLIFESMQDLDKLETSHPAYGIVKKCLTNSGDLEGFIVLLETEDLSTETALPGLHRQLHKVNWEGVSIVHDEFGGEYFHAIILHDNERATEYIIKRNNALDNRLLKSLEENLIDQG